MRIVGLLLVLCLGGGLTGCKNKGDGEVSDAEATKAQQELIARRDKLLDARRKLQAEREQLSVTITEIEGQGGDASEHIKKREEIDSALDTQTNELVSLVSNKLDEIKVSGDKSANVAAREAQLAARERDVAGREASFAERERKLAQRESEMAQRWKESCNVGGAPLIIQQAAPKGGNYTHKDVNGLISKARNAMAKKGIIASDLPGPAQLLESEASKAMADNDMSKAYFAAAQLVATVDAIHVNRAFIQAKTARLSAQVKTTKVDETTNKELADILGDVMSAYNNGDFAAANRRLNSLAAKLAR
jgi:hypothetical protein